MTPRPSADSDPLPVLARRLPLSSAQHFLIATGLLLIASAAVHGVVFLVSGDPWEGPLSWRKPILFGFSFGITAVTVALLASALRLGVVATWALLGSLAVASLLETALITMQTWRGVPSHFNFSSVFDVTVFIGMGVLVAIVALTLLVLAVLAFTSMHPVPPSLRLAIRAGLVLLIAAQVIGVLIIATGVGPAAIGDDAAVFGPNGVVIGAAGVLKSPHGIAMHAIQVVPVLALLAQLTPWKERRRILATGGAITGYTLIVVVSTMQAYTGQAAFALSWPAFIAAVLGLVLLAVPAVAVLASLNWARIRTRAGQQTSDDREAQPASRSGSNGHGSRSSVNSNRSSQNGRPGPPPEDSI